MIQLWQPGGGAVGERMPIGQRVAQEKDVRFGIGLASASSELPVLPLTKASNIPADEVWHNPHLLRYPIALD